MSVEPAEKPERKNVTQTDSPAPVVVIAYRRPLHLSRCLEALARNESAAVTPVTVFVDGPKDMTDQSQVDAVVRVAEEFRELRNLSVVPRPTNLGLAASVMDAVDRTLEDHSKVIVLEDDLIVSPYFLDYMNQGLHLYGGDSRVASVHGYVYPAQATLPPTFFLRGADCLGWGTWRQVWQGFERDATLLLKEIESLPSRAREMFDFGGTYPYQEMLRSAALGNINSWAIRWYASMFLQNRLTLYPGTSLVFHSGSDGSGTNVGVTSAFDVNLSDRPIDVEFVEPIDSHEARIAFEDYFCQIHGGERRSAQNVAQRIIGKLRRILYAK